MEFVTKQFGFNEAIIHIHPNDYADGDEKVDATSKYGLKMLGAFVGSDEFVKANIIFFSNTNLD